VEETGVQLVFKRLNVARHSRVFRTELIGCGRKRPGPRDRQKVSNVVPILIRLPVCHRRCPLTHINRQPRRPRRTKAAIADRAEVGDVPECRSPHIVNDHPCSKLVHYKGNAIP
jgi:hypothetical protein